ncbi:MAG TPA: hypothetical protein VMH04_04410 [Candidatus Solibacter sp.]|nr:hypothetical protein [Candidatus Solibacter sp.]
MLASYRLLAQLGSTRLAQKLRQALSDHIMQALVMFEHGCLLAPGDVVYAHGNLHHGSIQYAEHVEELFEIGWHAANTQLSP